MENKHITFILIATLAIFSCGDSFLVGQPLGQLCNQENSGPDSGILVQQNFDLNSCQRECRLRYGLEPQSDMAEQFRGGGGLGRGGYYEYANCIAACNSHFWKEFDRKNQDLEKLR